MVPHADRREQCIGVGGKTFAHARSYDATMYQVRRLEARGSWLFEVVEAARDAGDGLLLRGSI